IPANLALAVHPDADYVVFEVDGERYLVAQSLAARSESVIRGVDVSSPTTVVAGPFKGSEIEGVVSRHPLFDRPSPIVFADYVTMEDGTGVVHTAPGHGKEDFETGVNYGLDILCPVDAAGRFTNQAGEQFAGARILGGEADKRVIEALEKSGNLM